MGRDFSELIQEWSKKDAEEVVFQNHTRYREAEIRLRFIKMWPLSESQKEEFYNKYVELLTRKINKLRHGKRSWGEVPKYEEVA